MKTRIFQISFLIFSSVLSFSCSHSPFSFEEPKPQTITSDLFPENMSRTEYYRELAVGYANDNQNKKAIELFRLSLLHDPNNIKARLELADVYRQEGVDHLAHAQFAKVLRINPRNAAALQRQADLYFERRIFSKASEAYGEIYKLDSKNVQALWTLFSIAKEQQKYDLALSYLHQLEKVNVEDHEILFKAALEKATIYNVKRQWRKELESLEAAYGHKPNVLINVNLLADSYFRFEKWKEAQSVLQRYSDTNPFNLDVSEKLSFTALQSQDFDVVLREYSKQSRFVRDSYFIERKLAHIYFLTKDYKSAEGLYKKSIYERPDDDESTYFLSKIYQLTDRNSQSVALLKRIPTSSDYYGEAQVELADKEWVSGQAEEALTRLHKAHQNRPDLKIIYKVYADFLVERSQFSEATALIENGLSLFPTDEELRVKAAFAYYRLNDQKLFQTHMKKAISVNPQNREIYATLTEALQAKTRKANEVKSFVQQVLNMDATRRDLKPLLSWALIEQGKFFESVALFEEGYEKNPNDPFFAKTLSQIYRQGRVTDKAESFRKVAQTLEADNGLKAKLLNSVPPESRMPASLEPY